MFVNCGRISLSTKPSRVLDRVQSIVGAQGVARCCAFRWYKLPLPLSLAFPSLLPLSFVPLGRLIRQTLEPTRVSRYEWFFDSP